MAFFNSAVGVLQTLVVALGVRGKMNLPSCGKEFFPHTVSRFFFAQ